MQVKLYITVLWVLLGTIDGRGDAPLLTGLTRRGGHVRAFFETSDHQTSFAMKLGESWGGYRLVSVDFTNGLAVVDNGAKRYTTHFGISTAESSVVPPAQDPNEGKPVALPFTSEEEQFRTQYGQAAFAKWRQERFMQSLDGESDKGVVRPELLDSNVHR